MKVSKAVKIWLGYHRAHSRPETSPGVSETKKDKKLFRTCIEYHCALSGVHHGHVFDDRPPPTGKRFCNNGAVLIFEEDD